MCAAIRPANALRSEVIVQIEAAHTDAEIIACFRVLKFLRPHLQEAAFVPQVRRQQQQGYRLVFIRKAGQPVAAAGYRFAEFLAWGRILYVDDLITDPEQRGQGFGGALLDWLIAEARQAGCAELHLDSGYQRNDAHRLYLNKGLTLQSHHFSMKLS